MHPLRAVLFDLDGTLIDSVDHIVECWQHMGRTCLGRELTREEILPSLGRTLFDAFEEMAPGRTEEMLAAYRAHQVETHDTAVTLIPGVSEALAHLKSAGLVLGVVTSKGLPTATRGLNLFDLSPYFDTLVTYEDSTRHKPHPEPLLAASRRLGIEPAQMVYVGDAVVDVQAGKAAGMQTAGVTWGAGSISALSAAEPDYLFTNADELRQLAPAVVIER